MAPKLKPPKVKESDIQSQIIDYLIWRGIFVWRNYTGPIVRGGGARKVFFTPNPAIGAPDIMGVLDNGQMLAIEVKTSKGKLSPEQVQFLENLRQRGALVIVARSLGDVEDAMPAIAKTFKRSPF